MNSKKIGFLLVILIFLLSIGIGMCFRMPMYPPHDNAFQLQKEYAENLENKLTDLLEPAVGIGNVHASVNAHIIHQNKTKTQIDLRNGTRITTHERGPILHNQSVSVLINEKDKNKFYAYQNLIKATIGFNAERGDSLSIELLPFVKVPLWTLGLSPICLIKIALFLVFLLVIGLFWLIREWIHSKKSVPSALPVLNKTLWQKAEKISSTQWIEFLKTLQPEAIAFFLYHLSKEKAAEIIDLLPETYIKPVILHLNYIEKLSFTEQGVLLKQAETQLRSMLKTFYPQTQSKNSIFDDLKTWQNIDVPQLLHYVSKKDLTMALQTTPQTIQHLFSSHIPSSLWQNLILQMNEFPCSAEESDQAKEKIIEIVHLLKEES